MLVFFCYLWLFQKTKRRSNKKFYSRLYMFMFLCYHVFLTSTLNEKKKNIILEDKESWRDCIVKKIPLFFIYFCLIIKFLMTKKEPSIFAFLYVFYVVLKYNFLLCFYLAFMLFVHTINHSTSRNLSPLCYKHSLAVFLIFFVLNISSPAMKAMKNHRLIYF